ncbi:MAG: phosphoribosyltransferase [Clostridia bacterium]|jgi:hypoxanthine phosphoribosyltransferase
MYYISQRQFFNDLENSLTFIKKNIEFDLLFCVMKGGLIIGQYLAYKLNKPLFIIECNKDLTFIKTTFNFEKNEGKPQRILVVDEILDTGKTFGIIDKELCIKCEEYNLDWKIDYWCLYNRQLPLIKRDIGYHDMGKRKHYIYYYKEIKSKQWLTFFWDKF